MPKELEQMPKLSMKKHNDLAKRDFSLKFFSANVKASGISTKEATMGQDLGVPGQRHHDEEWRLGQAQQLMRHWAWRDSIGEADEDTLVALVRQGLRILGDMLGQVLQGLVPDDPVWKSAEAFPGVGTTAEVEGLLQGLWRGGFIDRQDPPSIYRINDKGRVLAMIVSIAVTGIDLEDPQLLIRW